MNSKGQSLAQFDLVRNHFAQSIPETAFTTAWGAFESARIKAGEKCDPFLSLWILARYGVSSTKDRLHKTFSSLVGQKRIVPDTNTLAGFTTDVARIGAYKRGQDMHGSPVDGLVWLHEIKARQHLPMLLAAEKLERNAPDLFARLCDEIARTVMTTTIADGGNAKYQHSWQRWARQIHTVSTEEELDAFLNMEEGMRAKRAELKDDLVLALAKSGDSTSWANDRPKRNPQQYLALAYTGLAVERATGNSRPARCFLEQVTLEHIIPAKAAYALEAPSDTDAFQSTVGALGNLTLLGGAENSGASNRPLAQKRGCYTASGVAMARALIQPLVSPTSRARDAKLLLSLPVLPDTFGPEAVSIRTQAMAGLIGDLLAA